MDEYQRMKLDANKRNHLLVFAENSLKVSDRFMKMQNMLYDTSDVIFGMSDALKDVAFESVHLAYIKNPMVVGNISNQNKDDFN